MSHQHTLGTEAIRAMVTLRTCWSLDEEIYINQGCLHCGSAATYLIYFTNSSIQKLMLDFIATYNCNAAGRFDLLDLCSFEDDYNLFLSTLEQHVIHYAFQERYSKRSLAFESVQSIFERSFHPACAYA
ncbi:hypothetical protein GCM10027155_17440 [Acinetobacter apis]|uniref:Uncharacterized protein n=1 Tax=Acinetobacter apis TaxID=1229165 RepID=A0A217EGB1_9GAMM|nr:hypothetical protein [Acinetobacter apis]SNQ29518.1 hypothetical protein SAMN05444584_1473 [Acinetobacter apis]